MSACVGWSNTGHVGGGPQSGRGGGAAVGVTALTCALVERIAALFDRHPCTQEDGVCAVAYPFGNMTQETGRREAICDLYGGELRWAGFSPTCIQGELSCPSMPRAPVTGSKRARSPACL